MHALVTGITGFVGGSLYNHLNSNNWKISGFDQHGSKNGPGIFIGNIQDQAALVNCINHSQPDVIFHLAGVIKSKSLKDYYNTHILGTLSLFEAIAETGCKPRIIIASSSAVYGSGYGKRPISEHFALRPITDYAISKLGQEMVARRFFLAYDFPVIIIRTFNLIGPGQSPELACSAFARQIALDEIHPHAKPIKTGNLSAQRDFVDVRDAVYAYELLAKNGVAGGTYNVCSGQAVSIQTCLNNLLGMATKPLTIEFDKSRMQKNDVPIQVGSAKLIERTVGWQPKIALQQSLSDLLNDWRKRIQPSAE
ncbi:MAG: GDP-mannose 4,6-dehydratase [Chloroflexi bacterium]|nr:GDP-mannose 4,6-dehydratase [Chloroflexota bacterium]